MLTTDREENRDFDINNLYLNLNFQKQTESFEYKWPLLDHPSNYQLIVTKLLTRTSLPYIRLNQSKKNPRRTIEPGDEIFYDYLVKVEYSRMWGFPNEFRTYQINQQISNRNNSRTAITSKGMTIVNREYNDDFIDYNNDYEINPQGIIQQRAHELFDVGCHRNIYSLKQIFMMIDKAIDTALKRCFRDDWGGDRSMFRIIMKFMNYSCVFLTLEDNRPKLYVHEEFFQFLKSSAKNKEDPIHNSYIRVFKLYFSRNLFKFLKGLPIYPCDEYEGEFCVLDISASNAPEQYDVIENQEETITWAVFTGEKLNIMELSDYIGLAITTNDLPIKEQIYPHFNFNPQEDNAYFLQNRKRYVSKSESNIIYTRIKGKIITQQREYVNDQIKSSTGERILFLKYFGKDDDLNCINYENNDANTTQRMDLMNVMPLKKFSLSLYLIDRFNNFEPLTPQVEGFEDVIKLQLLFTRIKGFEKENRDFIETQKVQPERVTLDLIDEPENEEEEEEEIPEEHQEIPEEHQEIPEEHQEISEEQLIPPPEKKIYLNNEEENDSENENELY